MDIRNIQANTLDLVPSSNGGYLVRQGNEKPGSPMRRVTKIEGVKILIIRPDSLPHLQADTNVWSRVINKTDVRTFSFDNFIDKGDILLTSFEKILSSLGKSERNDFFVITSDEPHFILDLISMLEESKAITSVTKEFVASENKPKQERDNAQTEESILTPKKPSRISSTGITDKTSRKKKGGITFLGAVILLLGVIILITYQESNNLLSVGLIIATTGGIVLLVGLYQRRSSSTVCSSCQNNLSFKRKLGGGWVDGNEIEAALMRTAYKCRRCSTPICRACTLTKRCAKCGGNVFDIDAARIR